MQKVPRTTDVFSERMNKPVGITLLQIQGNINSLCAYKDITDCTHNMFRALLYLKTAAESVDASDKWKVQELLRICDDANLQTDFNNPAGLCALGNEIIAWQKSFGEMKVDPRHNFAV